MGLFSSYLAGGKTAPSSEQSKRVASDTNTTANSMAAEPIQTNPDAFTVSATPPPATGNSIRYSLTRWDILRARLWWMTHNKFLVCIMVLASMGLPILSLSNTNAGNVSLTAKIIYVVIWTMIYLCGMMVIQIAIQILWVFLNNNRGVLGGHELEIREDGLFEKTFLNQSLHYWPGVQKCGLYRNFLFILVDGQNMHSVPLRCFASEDEAKRFYDEVKRRAEAASRTSSSAAR